MALKKSQLYRSLWSSCDALRGGMDASQYKDYVLTLLFMKYVSDKFANKTDALIEVPEGGSFADMVKLQGSKDLGEGINKIIGKLADANDLRGVIDIADFNDEDKLGKGKEMQDRLSSLVAIFDALDFSANHAEGDDLLGDAYEYLMRHFATESGKSKGQFYTPAEVSRIIARVIGIGPNTKQDQTIYDPTCGSGSLLLKAADQSPKGLTIYGQEMDNATWALARMNMILHGHATAEIMKGNTLSSPQLKDKHGKLQTFDFAVSNPPFSTKAWSHGLDPANDEFGRFEMGTPPPKNGDYAFLLHLIKSLKSTGKGAIILPHGILFRGNKEADIRRELVKRGYIWGIVGLPLNLFYGTGIPACLVIVDKENAANRTSIFMIDASHGFVKDGNKNRLRAQDIHKIVDVFTKQLEVPGYSRLVPISEIADPSNDYNLNLPRYIESSEAEDRHDLGAHLKGGIPEQDLDALSGYWQVFPKLRAQLFEPLRPGYARAKIPEAAVREAILTHPEFVAYAKQVASVFEKWRAAHEPLLMALGKGSDPKQTISTLSENLLAKFAKVPLIDNYDLYQHLLDYWHEVMQDDVYLIAYDGWAGAARPRVLAASADGKLKESPDLVVGKTKYKMDLLPPRLVIEKFLKAEAEGLADLQVERDGVLRRLEQFIEQHSGEEGVVEGLKNNAGTVTKGAAKARLKELKGEPGAAAEIKVIQKCLELIEADAEIARRIRAGQSQLEVRALQCYGSMKEAEIRQLAVEKWQAAFHAAVNLESARVTTQLAFRIQELEQRYGVPLPAHDKAVEAFERSLAEYLGRMNQNYGDLVVGKTRLVPFKGPWVECKLGDLLQACVGGSTPSRSRPAYFTGSIPWVASGDLNRGVVTHTAERISKEGLEAANLLVHPAGTFLMAITGMEAEGTRGNCGVLAMPAATNQSCLALYPNERLATRFLFQWYLLEGNRLALQYSQGTKQQSFTSGIVRELPIRLPRDLEEQEAIADVLEGMAAGISALDARAEKTRMLKHAAMQALLSGGVRLPPPRIEVDA